MTSNETKQTKNVENFHKTMEKNRLWWFENFTGHSIQNFTSFNKFIQWLHRPVNASSLGIFRMLFGIAMLIDISEERGGGILDARFGQPNNCHFPLFNFLQPFDLPIMGVIYFIMWLGALGIALGYKFKSSCIMFLIPYWYVFLLDKPTWNNHSYLYGLCGFLLFWTESNRLWSIEKQQENTVSTVPYWNYFLVKFQFFILYFIAGLKKLSLEWLSGYSMNNLGYHWLFLPFRVVLSVDMIDLLIVHWFAAIFDVSIAFLMIWKRTRLWVTPFLISFHLMNSRFFTIGMFPWVCLAEILLFYDFNWFQNVKDSNDIQKIHSQETNIKSNTSKKNSSNPEIESNYQSTFSQSIRTYLILAYCIIQLALPYSHFITKGFNNWTNGLYGYSWDMMVHSYDRTLTSIKVVDNKIDKSFYLDPYAYSQYDRWTKHADMAIQYAKCIEKNLIKDYETNYSKTWLHSKNLSIYFDVWYSMNKRFQQRVFNPNTDILKAQWSPFKETSWILPVLDELIHLRPKLTEITKHVLSWSNHSDVLFIADFPDLTLENFIPPDLENITITVLQGAVQLEDYNGTMEIIRAGERFRIKSNDVHNVTTISQIPSCFMYTYINKTMKAMDKSVNITVNDKWLPIWEEFQSRFENYKYFFYHVGNSIMFLVYGVPIPIRIPEVDDAYL